MPCKLTLELSKGRRAQLQQKRDRRDPAKRQRGREEWLDGKRKVEWEERQKRDKKTARRSE